MVGGKKSWRERETESWINYNFHPQCNVGYWGSREEGGKYTQNQPMHCGLLLLHRENINDLIIINWWFADYFPKPSIKYVVLTYCIFIEKYCQFSKLNFITYNVKQIRRTITMLQQTQVVCTC